MNRETRSFFRLLLERSSTLPTFSDENVDERAVLVQRGWRIATRHGGGFFPRAQTPVSNSLSSWPGRLCGENIRGWLMVLNREGKFRRPFTTKPCKKKKKEKYPAQSRDIILPYTGGPLLPLSPLSKELSRKKFCSREEEETDDF